jgi:hypothetical protein
MRFGVLYDSDDEVDSTEEARVDLKHSTSTDGYGDYNSDVDENEYDNNKDDEEVEEEHPLGFDSWGRSRFSLQKRPVETLEQYKERWGYLYPRDDNVDLFESPRPRAYPPIHHHHNYKTAPTSALIRYTVTEHTNKPNNDMERITQLLHAASLAADAEAARLFSPPKQASIESYGQRNTRRIQAEVDEERRRVERDQKDAISSLMMLIREDEARAESARKAMMEKEAARLEKEEKERQADELRRQIDEQRRQAEEEKRQEREKNAAEEQERTRIKQEKDEQKQAERMKVLEAERKERDFKGRAEKLVGQLQQVRASVAPFETSVATKQRRMRMKRTGGGKLNTLSEDEGKIRSVAAEVGAEIAMSQEEDDNFKRQVQAGDKSIPPEQCRGKRYFIDLLCSKVVVRIQAESFYG